uniref:Uncharacterized protein n=1 Tax=Oryza brachyantha TaxID=4533 RepID=J3LNT5_ORYBR
MADSCCMYMHEMDDVHRWLPSEVLRDIGIVDTAERLRFAVVEDLAVRLVGVLGGGGCEMAVTPYRSPLPSCHRPQVGGGGGATFMGHHALADAGCPRGAGAPPPYMPPPLPAPASPWHVTASGPRNATVLRGPTPPNHPHPLLRVRGAVAGAAHQPATTRRSSGTGFFLPRTAAAGHANHHGAARA